MWIIFLIIFDTGQSTHHPTNKKPSAPIITRQLSQPPVIYQILSPFVDESALSLQGGGHKFEPCSAHTTITQVSRREIGFFIALF